MAEIEWSAELSREYARYMERNVRHDHRPWAERIVRDLPERRPGAVVLDVAGGPAFLALEVAALLERPRVIVTDLSPTMLEIGRERAAARGIPIECRTCPAEKLDVPSGSVDLALCKHFLRLAPDVDAVLAEMARVLKPGGRAYLVDFDGKAPWLTGRLLELWVLLTAPAFLRRSFPASRRSGLPASRLPARLAAVGLFEAAVLHRGVTSMVRAVRPDGSGREAVDATKSSPARPCRRGNAVRHGLPRLRWRRRRSRRRRRLARASGAARLDDAGAWIRFRRVPPRPHRRVFRLTGILAGHRAPGFGRRTAVGLPDAPSGSTLHERSSEGVVHASLDCPGLAAVRDRVRSLRLAAQRRSRARRWPTHDV